MIEIDFEDFVEEVKFQLTEYEDLEEKIILDWETKMRDWITRHNDKKAFHVKSKDDVRIFLKDEDEMYDIANQYYMALHNKKDRDYWKHLKWGR